MADKGVYALSSSRWLPTQTSTGARQVTGKEKKYFGGGEGTVSR